MKVTLLWREIMYNKYCYHFRNLEIPLNIQNGAANFDSLKIN